MNRLEEYMKQNIFEPTYLFHGSPLEIEQLELRQSNDSENKDNEDYAIFLTSWFLNAAAYAFRDKLKEFNKHWSFSINNNGQLPAMEFEVDNIPEDLMGYIYIFKKDEFMIKDNHENTTQYRCYHNLKPIDVVQVYYKDFADYFKRTNISKSR